MGEQSQTFNHLKPLNSCICLQLTIMNLKERGNWKRYPVVPRGLVQEILVSYLWDQSYFRLFIFFDIYVTYNV